MHGLVQLWQLFAAYCIIAKYHQPAAIPSLCIFAVLYFLCMTLFSCSLLTILPHLDLFALSLDYWTLCLFFDHALVWHFGLYCLVLLLKWSLSAHGSCFLIPKGYFMLVGTSSSRLWWHKKAKLLQPTMKSWLTYKPATLIFYSLSWVPPWSGVIQ